MKMFKKDKNRRRFKSGLLTLLVGFTALLSGCGQSVNVGNDTVSPTNEPAVVSVTPAPTATTEPPQIITPSPEPTATPEPTPFVRTSFEIPDDEYVDLEVERLGLIDDDTVYCDNTFQCMYFIKDGQQKAMCVIVEKPKSKKESCTVRDAFTDELLFKFKESDCKSANNDKVLFSIFKKLDFQSGYFDDVDIANIEIYAMWFDWAFVTRQYMDKSEFKRLIIRDIYGESETYANYEHFNTREEIARYYVKYCLPELRVNMYDLHPEISEEQDPVKHIG